MTVVRTIQAAVAALVLILSAAVLQQAHAFQLLPMAMEFAPAGPEATQTFGIHNEGEQPVAVQMSVVKREVALDGTETLTPADNEFLVFPPQAIVAPGKVQLVQVRWLGTRAPAKELAYRIIAEQLPVNLDERPREGGRIEILMRYEGSVYIVPQGAAPDVVVESVTRVQTPDGPRLAVTVRNRGSAHGLLRNTVLTVAGRGMDGRAASVELRNEALNGMASANILSGSARQFLLAWPANLEPADLNATLRTGYVK